MKTVAVIISTYKGALHICRQLDSIFDQEGVNVRVFIRDDHSPDNTIEVVEAYKLSHPDRRIDYVTGETEGYAAQDDRGCGSGISRYSR